MDCSSGQPQFASLDKTSRQIRLFKFSCPPSAVVEDWRYGIIGSLEVFDLDEAPAYHALSYEWGAPHFTDTILVDNCELEITSNLSAFLHACFSTKARHWPHDSQLDSTIQYLWADQICIAQQNSDERSHQVGLMSLIFGRARRVLAWLGATSPLEEILWLNEQWAGEGMPPDTRQMLRDSITTSSLFSRLWVQQELVLARDLTFVAGSDLFEWKDINDAFAEFSDLVKYHPALKCRHRSSVTGRGLGYVEAIDMFASKACSDPRDKVYGLQAMIETSERIVVDYNLSTEQVFELAVQQYGNQTWSRCSRDWITYFQKEQIIQLGHHMGIDPQKIHKICQLEYGYWYDQDIHITRKLHRSHVMQSSL